jgi:hypothetical protein
LIVSAPVLKTMAVPSTMYHTGAAWGLPSGLVVASTAGRAGSELRKAQTSSSVIFGM